MNPCSIYRHLPESLDARAIAPALSQNGRATRFLEALEQPDEGTVARLEDLRRRT
jgi:hypothetical protein